MNIMLIHGGFLGPWSWSRVAPILRAAGHIVVTPALSGLRQQDPPSTSAAELSTHVCDVVKLICQESLSDIVLVGHSYGGIVAAGVAAEIPTRVAQLIFLDALLPETGQSYFDVAGADVQTLFETLANDHGDRLRVPVFFSSVAFGVTGDDVLWTDNQMAPLPICTLHTPVHFAYPPHVPTAYVACTAPSASPAHQRQAEQARSRGWLYAELRTGHIPMISMPQQTAKLLLSLACNLDAPGWQRAKQS